MTVASGRGLSVTRHPGRFGRGTPLRPHTDLWTLHSEPRRPQSRHTLQCTRCSLGASQTEVSACPRTARPPGFRTIRLCLAGQDHRRNRAEAFSRSVCAVMRRRASLRLGAHGRRQRPRRRLPTARPSHSSQCLPPMAPSGWTAQERRPVLVHHTAASASPQAAIPRSEIVTGILIIAGQPPTGPRLRPSGPYMQPRRTCASHDAQPTRACARMELPCRSRWYLWGCGRVRRHTHGSPS